MTGSVAIDVVIGLVFIYLLYSLLASVIQEVIATNFSFRAKILEKAITRMLEDEAGKSAFSDRLETWSRLVSPTKRWGKSLSKSFYEHPLVKYLGEDKWNGQPAYISSKDFAKVLLDLLRGKEIKPGDNMRAYIEKSLYSEDDPEDPSQIGSTKEYLRSLWVDAQGDIEEFKESLEDWFDTMMERASSWYKQYNQVFLLIVGLIISVLFNVDTIEIVQRLSKDPELRAQIVAQADKFREEHPELLEEYELLEQNVEADTSLKAAEKKELKDKAWEDYQKLKARRDSLINKAQDLLDNEISGISQIVGLGWSNSCEGKSNEELGELDCKLLPNGDNSWPERITGWLLTALAISLGAPFWFDLLNKLMRLRGAVQSAGGKQMRTGTKGKSSDANNTVKRVG